MVVLRNRLTATRSGGPRQFAELRDKIIVKVGAMSSQRDVKSELDRLDLEGKSLRNNPVILAEPRDKMTDVLERLRHLGDDNIRVRQAIDEVSNGEKDIMEVTSSITRATAELMESITLLSDVANANFVLTFADYGPENLRLSPREMPTLDVEEAAKKNRNLEQLNNNLNLGEAWAKTRGENCVVAVFDTAFSEDMFSSGRVVNTFHSGGTDSAYESQEGHGTMCAGAAAASKKDGLPYNGSAPGSDVILVRITDDEGQIRDDIVADAWDWLTDLNLGRPIVANHSYGMPLCTGRPRGKFCNDIVSDVIKGANSDSDILSVYAAGNEAMSCGHRPSGLTNAITGHNSLAEVIAVGALRFDERDAQRYSSHGRGDCSPIADPKPNVSAPIPTYTYYGGDDGWEIKDMGMGVGGSGGGTSHAAPTTAGMIALIQSYAMEKRGEPLQTEEVKKILRDNSKPPRRTQVNIFSGFVGNEGFDARFGHGILDINKALEDV